MILPACERVLQRDGRSLLAVRMAFRNVAFFPNLAPYLVRGFLYDLGHTKMAAYTLARHPAMKAKSDSDLEGMSARSYACAVELHCESLLRVRAFIEHLRRLAQPLRIESLERAWDMIGRILDEPRLVRLPLCQGNFAPACSP